MRCAEVDGLGSRSSLDESFKYCSRAEEESDRLKAAIVMTCEEQTTQGISEVEEMRLFQNQPRQWLQFIPSPSYIFPPTFSRF